MSSSVVALPFEQVGASLTGVDREAEGGDVAVHRAVVGLEGEAVGAVVVGVRRIGATGARAAQVSVRGVGLDRVGERVAVDVGAAERDRLGVSSSVVALPFEQVGASLTALIVRLKVATLLSTVPSLAEKVKLSVPL